MSTKRKLPPEVAERIGPYYVYLLVDPRNEQVFYVGKGTGDRLLSHGVEAEQLSAEREPAKLTLIREVRAEGLEPRIDVVRHALTEANALLIEAALIDCLPKLTLTNRVRGVGASDGRQPLGELVAEFGAQQLEDDVPVPALLIRLGQWKDQPDDAGIPGRRGHGYRAGMAAEELYNSTRVWWKVSMSRVRRQGIHHAVAVHASITRAVYQIDEWFPREHRWGFDGTLVASGPIHEAYVGDLGRRVKFRKGQQSPTVYWPRESLSAR